MVKLKYQDFWLWLKDYRQRVSTDVLETIRKLRGAGRELEPALVLEAEAKKAVREEQRRLRDEDLSAWEAVVLREQDVDIDMLASRMGATDASRKKKRKGLFF